MSTIIGIASTRYAGNTRQFVINTAGLKEGAIVIHDSSAAGGKVKAPTGAGNSGIAGVIVNQQPAAGTAVGDSVDVQYDGVANVLLGTTLTVTDGGYVIINTTDGSCKALGSTDSCDVLGKTLLTRTAGAANELIPVQLGIFYVGDNVP